MLSVRIPLELPREARRVQGVRKALTGRITSIKSKLEQLEQGVGKVHDASCNLRHEAPGTPTHRSCEREVCACADIT